MTDSSLLTFLRAQPTIHHVLTRLAHETREAFTIPAQERTQAHFMGALTLACALAEAQLGQLQDAAVQDAARHYLTPPTATAALTTRGRIPMLEIRETERASSVARRVLDRVTLTQQSVRLMLTTTQTEVLVRPGDAVKDLEAQLRQAGLS